jgi:mannose-1-phosphate guanylyltransferase
MGRRAAVILAGGAGTRLWPLSRLNQPKQLIPLIDGKCLLRLVYEGLVGPFEPSQIHVITNAEQLPGIAEVLPELGPTQLIGEPALRDSANAIGLAASLLHLQDPETIMAVFSADTLIDSRQAFHQDLGRALQAVEQQPDALVIFGQPVSWPNPALGYVHRGQQLDDWLYRVKEFKEKPDAATAEQYHKSGEYYWNSGMFFWRTSTFLAEFARCMPESHKAITRIAERWNWPGGREAAAPVYRGLERISIDYAVMEKARSVLVVPMQTGWTDIGSWQSLWQVLDRDADQNVVQASNATLVDAKGNLVVSADDHLIAAFGAQDLVIIHSGDATLVTRREDAGRLKELVTRIKEQHGDKFL